MEHLPAHVSVVFLITTFITVGIFLYAVRKTGFNSTLAKILIFVIPFWMIFQAVVSLGGFFQNTDALPPRLFIFGVGPALLLILLCFLFARQNLVANLPIKVLTIIHVIRIPVELTLSWLYDGGMVPRIMTFHGTNFDILSGITAPVVYYLAFRGGSVNKPLLVGWNIAALLLVFNIVITAILCLPSPIQQLAFDQPNLGVLYFPFSWLPTVVVPIVFFCHFASLYKLVTGTTK
ncbi:MAG: hypothetical protein WBD27_17325 [Pyrinomonadaceae bacterium]